MTFAEWMRRVASGAPALVLVVAQTASGFVDLRAVDTPAPAGQVLFLPLDRSFTGCVPLDAVCPPDSSTVVLIPAAGRSIAWVPDGAELPASDDAIPDVDAIGSAPPDASSARYLVPVLDGRGSSLTYATKRLDGGALIADADADSATGDTVTPQVVGPSLSTTPPSGVAPERLVGRPRIVDAASLQDVSTVLVARRAHPSRVVFGVASDPAWGMSVGFVPLVDTDGLAHVARHDGAAGLVVSPPANAVVGAPSDASSSAANGAGGGEDDAAASEASTSAAAAADAKADDGRPWPLLLVGLAVLAGVALVAVLLARASRRRGAG